MAELSDHCFIKSTWEGTPEGSLAQIGGIECYVASPKENGDATKALLYLPDIFGIGLVNSKLLADDFARAGFHTYIVDYFHGDPQTDSMRNDPNFDRAKWFAQFPRDRVQGDIEAVISELKGKGVTKFAATAYCFGAPYVVNLAESHTISVGIQSHPSLLKIPGDFERLKAAGVPVLFNTCEVDMMYPPESQKAGDDVLGDGGMEKKGLYRRKYWAGCNHGFAVRADMSVDSQRKGKEESFEESVNWLRENAF